MRKNLTDQLISLEIASRVGKWKNLRQKDIQSKFSVDLNSLQRRAALYVKSEIFLYGFLKDYPRHHFLTYEDLYTDNVVNKHLVKALEENFKITLPNPLKTPLHSNEAKKQTIISNYESAKKIVDDIVREYRTPFVDYERKILKYDFSNIIRFPAFKTDIPQTIKDLQNNNIGKIIVYGSAEIAVEFYLQAMDAGIFVLAFFESEPSPGKRGPDGEPVLTPENALRSYPDIDILLATKSSVNPMLHRLCKSASEKGEYGSYDGED